MAKHKHAEVIKAWADGAKIEGRFFGELNWHPYEAPSWLNDYEYRIKPEPEPEPDRVYLQNHLEYGTEGVWCKTGSDTSCQQVKWTIDGETGRIKSVELLDK